MIIIMVMTGDGDDAADGDDDGDDMIMPVAPMMMLTTVRAKMAMIMAGDGDEDDDDDGDADGGDDGHDDDDDGADDDDAAEDEDDSDCVFFAGEDYGAAAVHSSMSSRASLAPDGKQELFASMPRSLACARVARRQRQARSHHGGSHGCHGGPCVPYSWRCSFLAFRNFSCSGELELECFLFCMKITC